MEPGGPAASDGQHLFLSTPPLFDTRRLAEVYGCDLGVPNDAGVGNILMYTRVVDDLAFSLGRPLRLLTGPLTPAMGKADGEQAFPIWEANPCVDDIVNAEEMGVGTMDLINRERDNLCQFNHMIENISLLYGLRPRFLRPSLYLTVAEQRWALQELAGLRRPVLCLHPYGSSSPRVGSPWFEAEWRSLIDDLADNVSIIEVGLLSRERKDLATWRRFTTLRQMFALVWASDLFVGFDSCVAHVATAFGRPAAVLWDPFRKLEIEEKWQTGFSAAALTRWSYPQNKNLMLLGDRSHEVRGLVLSWIRETCRLMRS